MDAVQYSWCIYWTLYSTADAYTGRCTEQLMHILDAVQNSWCIYWKLYRTADAFTGRCAEQLIQYTVWLKYYCTVKHKFIALSIT
jgi:hypothetical protein